MLYSFPKWFIDRNRKSQGELSAVQFLFRGCLESDRFLLFAEHFYRPELALIFFYAVFEVVQQRFGGGRIQDNTGVDFGLGHTGRETCEVDYEFRRRKIYNLQIGIYFVREIIPERYFDLLWSALWLLHKISSLNFWHKSITIQPKVNSKKEFGLIVERQRIDEIFSHMGGNSIIILGDLMMDRYLWGDVNRISPEAPVPVVEVRNETLLLGGAANVAVNIRKLGDNPHLVGVVGNDLRSETFNILLGDNGIRSDGIVMDNSRPTTIKTRIIAHNQQVVRADHETTEDISREIEKEIFAKIKAKISDAKGLIISDYGKGVITKKLLGSLINLCRENGVFIAVDPKDVNFKSYKRVSVITPNHHEAGFAYGKRIRNEDDLKEVGWGLLRLLDAESLLITRGPEGMALFEKSGSLTFLPTAARRVYDVTGAGDTVISAIVSAVAAGASLPEAAYISNQAAGLVVAELGTAQTTKEALMKEINKRLKGNNNG